MAPSYKGRVGGGGGLLIRGRNGGKIRKGGEGISPKSN